MDVETVSWVGDLYQKFEAMCVEAEENVYQDTVMYVESQAKTVGACVKRFYSDVMQDLLPLSSDDLVKRESPASHIVNYVGGVIHDMSEVQTQKEPTKATTEILGEDSYPCHSGEKLDGMLLHSGVFAPKNFRQDGTCETGEEKICIENNCGNECVASTSITSSSSLPTALDEHWNREDMLKVLAGTCASEATIQDDIRGDYAEKLVVEVPARADMKLEESCVLVDKHEACPPHQEGNQRSYKKKIKEALYPRSWSRSKNGANEHENMEPRSDKGSRISAVDADTRLRGNESLEPGWEIV